MTPDDHKLWMEHDLGERDCTFKEAERTNFEANVTHLFAENAGAGDRNGFKAAELAQTTQVVPY